MKDKRCFTCKYQGKISLETLNNLIFHPHGKSHTLLLCYSHSVEFFKIGQRNFLAKYNQDMSEFFGFEEDRATLSYFSQYR